MEHAENEYKKYSKTNSKKKKIVTPNWFNETQTKETISNDAEDLTNLLSKY